MKPLSWIAGGAARFRERHPLLGDAILWAGPAILFGMVLRLLFLHYSPYAFWGADSRSYFGFSHGVLTDFYFSINAKRRYLYPIFLLPVSLLPGGTLRALAWIQAFFGLVSLFPLAYAIRRSFVHWRWFIVPLTVIYTGMPLLIWQEHELIADTLFFDGLLWALAGWMAFAAQSDEARSRRLYWWFLVPFGLSLLTKPSGLFFWPGIALGLIVVRAYRVFRWPQWAATAGVFLLSLTAGDKTQSAWLLYSSAFPLTQIDTPLHADYKAEIRGLVEAKRARILYYHGEDDEVNRFLRGPSDQTERPLWRELGHDQNQLRTVYRDLALEGIAAHPRWFLLIGLERLLGSCNPSDFSETRFKATYSASRMEETYAGEKVPKSMMRLAYGLKKDAPYSSLEDLQEKVSPYPDSKAAEWLMRYVRAYHGASAIVAKPPDANSPVTDARPTVLGWMVILGAAGAMLGRWRTGLGVWVLASMFYLLAVYLVGIQQTRYFSAIWPVCVLLLAVLPEWAIRGLTWLIRWAKGSLNGTSRAQTSAR